MTRYNNEMARLRELLIANQYGKPVAIKRGESVSSADPMDEPEPSKFIASVDDTTMPEVVED